MTIYALGELTPQIADSAFIAPNATVIGNVTLAEHTSVWFGAVLRGDVEAIRIGAGSNVQDGAVMHADPGYPLIVGSHVVIGHQAMLHGCSVGDGALIGLQAVVLNGAVIGNHCLVGAGAIVTEGKVFPERCLILGAPAKVVRELSDAEVTGLLSNAQHYVERRELYRTRLRQLD